MLRRCCLYFILNTLLLITNAVKSQNSIKKDTVKVYNSCSTLQDGEYYFKLSHDGTIIKAKCSNQQLIIDYNLDNNIEDYFTSWREWHYALAGPENGNQVNWKNWFIPSAQKQESTFKISPDCSVCDDTNNPIASTESDVAYYMTGNLFGCFWYLRGVPICDFDYDTYECRCCEMDDNLYFYVTPNVTVFYDDILFTDTCFLGGACSNYIRSSEAVILPDHESCAQSSRNSFKPSLGLNGRYCVCYDDNSKFSNFIEVPTSDLPEVVVTPTEDKGSINDNYELYQEDFTTGTYRITKSGTYKIMEDIIFDFNRPSDFIAGESSPNGISKWAWWADPDTQSDIYEGAGSYHGPYFLGFFTGIAIEVEDVILNLNNHEIKMSKEFYSQQRYFSLIELASQPFMPGQGPGQFGAKPLSANNVKIFDGKLGLTSHHGIHGNRAKNIYIENLAIYDFETHGIQVNGFENLYINNVDIGPMNQNIQINHNYLYGRMLLPRMQHIAETNPTETISFVNRKDVEWTMQDLIDELIIQLDMAFNYVNYDITPEVEDDEHLTKSWESAQLLFLSQSDGYFYGASVYGIFLNLYGSSVFSFHLNNRYSQNAVVSNVKVHGLRHKASELIRIHAKTTAFDGSNNNLNIFQNALNGMFDVRHIFTYPTDWRASTYTGTLMTDIAVAMSQLILPQEEDDDNWGILQLHDTDSDQFDSFAMGNDKSLQITEGYIGCNSDIMLHTLKGIFGMRIDGVETIELSNIEIYDLESFTDVGNEDICGSYTVGLPGGGQFTQRTPFLTGYSGNQVQGISFDDTRNIKLNNINIHDLTSHTGLAFGISFFIANSAKEIKNIKVYNINAGTDVEEGTYPYVIGNTNRAPEACGIRLAKVPIGDRLGEGDASILSNVDDATIYVSCIKGHVTCNDEGLSTMIGKEYTNSECSDDTIDTIYNEIISNVDENRILLEYKSEIGGNETYFSKEYTPTVRSESGASGGNDGDELEAELGDELGDELGRGPGKSSKSYMSKSNIIINNNNNNNNFNNSLQIYLTIGALLILIISAIYYVYNIYYKNGYNKINNISTKYGTYENQYNTL